MGSAALEQEAPNLGHNKGRYYVQQFHFEGQKPCFCRSGKSFGQCCGNPSAEREKPRDIHVVNNFISPSERKRFIRFAEKQKRTWLSVVDSSKSNRSSTALKRDPSRITQQIALSKRQSVADEWFRAACTQELTKFARPQWYESPHLLRYGPGGKYAIHSDAEHYDHDNQQFYRFIDRDFSMLIYLNDDYQGGGLNYPWLKYQYQPVAGDLVFFPSNHIFTHESLPITQGCKYALVSWGAFHGTPRVMMPSTSLPL